MIRIDGKTIIMTQANTGSIQFNMYGPKRLPMDLSPYTLTFIVKKSKKDPDTHAMIVKILNELPDNHATFVLRPNDTRIPVGTYWWGCTINLGDYVNEFASGPFIITDGVKNA